MTTKENFKELFLNLTEYTIPYKHEHKLLKYLPSGYKKDSVGNYYYIIGNSETLFTTHLDTYSKEYKKVNHVIDENDSFIISTDETTILGGDNKLGCSILISMINDRIPGCYYFFIGEEPIISGGVYGSKNALNNNPSFFKKFKRAIAFDRKEYGSVVTRQMARNCCSQGFSSSLVNMLKSQGISWDKDTSYGYYTDTAVFMDVIPECTNISAGGFNEHYKSEWVNLNYTYDVYKAACNINWESLPVEREISTNNQDNKTLNKYLQFKLNSNADKISTILSIVDLKKTTTKIGDDSMHIVYSKWLEDYDINIHLYENGIKVNNEETIHTMQSFCDYILSKFKKQILSEMVYYYENKMHDKMIKISKIFGYKDLSKFIENLI